MQKIFSYIGASSFPFLRLSQHQKIKNVISFQILHSTRSIKEAKQLEERLIKENGGLSSNISKRSSGLNPKQRWFYIYKLQELKYNK